MPAPVAKAIVITASVLIAAGIAAYESPQVREWVDKSRRKIVVVIQNFGEEFVNPSRLHGKRERIRRDTDPSMGEDRSEEAEERRRRARVEIMERGRIIEERKRRQQAATGTAGGDLAKQRDSGVEMTDVKPLGHGEGNLPRDEAITTAFDHRSSEGLTKRGVDLAEERMTTSNYETNLRQTFNLPLPPLVTTTSQPPSSHVTSPSLVDLTPTSSEFPDPDYSIPDSHTLSPSPSESHHNQQDPTRSLSPSSYFSIPEPQSHLPPTISNNNNTTATNPFLSDADDEDDGIPTPLHSPTTALSFSFSHTSNDSNSNSIHDDFHSESDAFSEISHPGSHHAGAPASDADNLETRSHDGTQWSEVSSNVSGDQ